MVTQDFEGLKYQHRIEEFMYGSFFLANHWAECGRHWCQLLFIWSKWSNEKRWRSREQLDKYIRCLGQCQFIVGPLWREKQPLTPSHWPTVESCLSTCSEWGLWEEARVPGTAHTTCKHHTEHFGSEPKPTAVLNEPTAQHHYGNTAPWFEWKKRSSYPDYTNVYFVLIHFDDSFLKLHHLKILHKSNLKRLHNVPSLESRHWVLG